MNSCDLKFAVGVCAAYAFLLCPQLAIADQPLAGTYLAHYITQTVSPDAVTCSYVPLSWNGMNPPGHFSGLFYYPGPGQKGALLTFTDAQLGNGTYFGMPFALYSYPTTPPAGAGTWSGTVKVNNEGNGNVASASFSMTIYYFTKRTFKTASTTVYVDNGNSANCTITDFVNYVRTGD